MEITKPEEKLTFAWQYLYLKELTNQHNPITTANYRSGTPDGRNIDRCLYYYNHYIGISYDLICRYRLFDVVPNKIRNDLAAILADIGNYYTPQHALGRRSGSHCYGFVSSTPFPEKDDVIKKMIVAPKGEALNFWTQELVELIYETKVALYKLELMLPSVSHDISLFLTPMVGNGLSDTIRKGEPLTSCTHTKLVDKRIINTFVEFEDQCSLVISFLKTIQYACKDAELDQFIAEIETLRACVKFHDFSSYQIVHVTAFDTRDISTNCVQKLDTLLDRL